MIKSGQLLKCVTLVMAWNFDMKWTTRKEIHEGSYIIFISEVEYKNAFQIIFLCEHGLCKSSQWFEASNFWIGVERISQ